jgi:hypothetical protein
VKKYILGNVETIGKERHIQRVYKIPNTPIETYIYKKAFYNWACKQTTKNLDNWKQYSIKCFEHIPWHKESIIWENEYDLLLESLEKFSTYEEYYSHTMQCETNQCIEFVENLLLFDKNLLSYKEKLYIYNITLLCHRLDNRVNRLIQLHKHAALPIIMENERNQLDKLYKDVHRGTDSKTLEIFSRILHDMKGKQRDLQTSVANNKGKQKELLTKLIRVQSFCESMEIGGAPREDIYKKSKRLAGAGWSNQK